MLFGLKLLKEASVKDDSTKLLTVTMNRRVHFSNIIYTSFRYCSSDKKLKSYKLNMGMYLHCIVSFELYEEESRIFHCFNTNRVMSGFLGEVDCFVRNWHAIHTAIVVGLGVQL